MSISFVNISLLCLAFWFPEHSLPILKVFPPLRTFCQIALLYISHTIFLVWIRCSANPGGNYTASDLWSHHTRPPPTSRRVPLSHCQRPFGRKTTTLGYHTTSHRTGHTICWLGRTSCYRTLVLFKTEHGCKSPLNLMQTKGLEPLRQPVLGTNRCPSYPLSANLAVPRGNDPLLRAWQARVRPWTLWHQNFIYWNTLCECVLV